MKRKITRNIKYLYTEYIKEFTNKYNANKFKLEDCTNNLSKSIEYIINNEEVYKFNFNIDVHDFISNIDNIRYKDINAIRVNPKSELCEFDIFLLQGYLKSIKINTRLISFYNTSISKHKNIKNTLDYDMFKFILESYNLKISESILLGNKRCNLGFNIGTILIKEKPRYYSEPTKYKSKFINWKESNENKQRIIDNGELPYYKKHEDIAKELNVPYNGVKWLSYYNDDVMYWWCWNKNIRLRNKELYSFTPTKYKNTKIRSIEYILNLSEEEIIKTNKLGNQDKLFSLLKKNNNYKTLYKKDYDL